MAPIPIYSKSPINAAKASGVTPETIGSSERGPGAESSATPATPSKSTGSGYPAARPGAVASIPEPTSSVRYAPMQPTPTERLRNKGPPPPQPGAAPIPPSTKAALGPPPTAGESYRAPEMTPTPQLPGPQFPPQMAIPAPAATFSQRGTYAAPPTAPTAGLSPVHVPGAPVGQSSPAEGFGHPPGYHQNPSAPAFSDYQQRASQDAADGNRLAEEDDEGIWSSAKKWANAAGQKLSEAESEVWRRINEK